MHYYSKKDAKISSALCPRISWPFLTKPNRVRRAHSDCGTPGNCHAVTLSLPPLPTHAHRKTTCLLLSRGRGARPQARGARPTQGCLISSKINHAEGQGAPQIPQANMQVKQHHLPGKGLFKLTRRGRNQATKPALSSKVNLCPPALWGGNLQPPPCPLLPLLVAYPRPELSTAYAPIPDLVKVRRPWEGRAGGPVS